MIYNLYQYIKDNIAGMNLTVNGYQPSDPDDVVMMQEGPGGEEPWFDRQDQTISFQSRAKDKPLARQNALTVYNLIRKKYRCELPERTVDGEVFPAITAWAIRPVNKPQFSHDDGNGRHYFAFSVEITTTQTNIQ